jgi:hypothetical protein
MADYFGNGCPHLCAKWEDQQLMEEAGIDFKEHTPVLSFCKHEGTQTTTKETVTVNCVH